MRDMRKAIDAGRRVVDVRGRLDITIHETATFCQRLKLEPASTVVWDAYLFGLSTGYRAGRREGKTAI